MWAQNRDVIKPWRLCYQAATDNEKFSCSPHQLRHTYLRRAAEKHDIRYAHKMSSNKDINITMRYGQPSRVQVEKVAESLWDGMNPLSEE